ncbi:MAG: penicillin-binding protein 2 [Planctomycetota bacterium]|nr:penicillin-binding protein 2 [Planctomycetota bacterium]
MIWKSTSSDTGFDPVGLRLRLQDESIARLIFLLVGLCFLLVLIRSGWMQLVDRDYWSSVQSSAQSRNAWDPGSRGNIYDRQGIVLAEDRESFKVGFDPYSATLVQLAAARGNPAVSGFEYAIEKTFLLPGLQLARPAAEIARQIRQVARRNEEIALTNEQLSSAEQMSIQQYVYIGTVNAGRDEIDFQNGRSELHRDLGRPVIPTLEPFDTRVYPHGDFGTLVIGELRGDRKIGLHGIELAFNDHLLGRRGLRQQSTDTVGRPLSPPTHTVPSIQGEAVELTIGIQEQSILEKVLADTLLRTGAQSVTGIVMDPRNGEVLAMSTYPGLVRGELQTLWNQNRQSDAFPKMQRAMLMSMEPGSIIKPLILTAALESGMHLDDPVAVTKIVQRFAGRRRPFTDSHLLRDRTLRGTVVESSNIGIVDIGLRLGNKRVHRIFKKFGLGDATGIDLGREENGWIKPPSKWRWDTLASASFGYEIQVTPIQMIRAYCAIANGGELITPHFRRRPDRLVNPDRNPRVTSESIAASVREVLRSVVLEGTGKGVRGTIGLAGKTGTAKVAGKGGYLEDHYISSFVGFAPWHAPERIAMVVVEIPSVENSLFFASKSAAPAVKEILEAVLHSPENLVQERLEEVQKIFHPRSLDQRESVPHLDSTARADSLNRSRSDRQGEGEPGRWNHGEGN